MGTFVIQAMDPHIPTNHGAGSGTCVGINIFVYFSIFFWFNWIHSRIAIKKSYLSLIIFLSLLIYSKGLETADPVFCLLLYTKGLLLIFTECYFSTFFVCWFWLKKEYPGMIDNIKYINNTLIARPLYGILNRNL